jgi:hypothetical protein
LQQDDTLSETSETPGEREEVISLYNQHKGVMRDVQKDLTMMSYQHARLYRVSWRHLVYLGEAHLAGRLELHRPHRRTLERGRQLMLRGKKPMPYGTRKERRWWNSTIDIEEAWRRCKRS